MKAKSLLVASLCAMSFAFAACGGNDDAAATDSTATMDSTPVTAPAPAAPVADSAAAPVAPVDTTAAPTDTAAK